MSAEPSGDCKISDPRYVSGRLLSDLRVATIKPTFRAEVSVKGQLVQREDGRCKLWFSDDGNCRPTPGRYIVGCDINGWPGSAITVFDCKSGGKKVLSFCDGSLESPKSLADLAINLCKIFADDHGNPAFLIWNNKGSGWMFGERIEDCNFGFHYCRDDGKSGYDDSRQGELIERYCRALEVGLFCNPDRDAIEELQAYRIGQDGGPFYSASDGRSSVVTADALCWFAYLSEQFYTHYNITKRSSAYSLRKFFRWILFLFRNRFQRPLYPYLDDMGESPVKLHIGPWGRVEWVCTTDTWDMQKAANNYYGMSQEKPNGDRRHAS